MAKLKKQIGLKKHKKYNSFDMCFNQHLKVSLSELHPIFSHYLVPGGNFDIENMSKSNNKLVFTVTIESLINS